MSLKRAAKLLEKSLSEVSADPDITELAEIFPEMSKVDGSIGTILGLCCGRLMREGMTPEQLGVAMTLLGRAIRRSTEPSVLDKLDL